MKHKDTTKEHCEYILCGRNLYNPKFFRLIESKLGISATESKRALDKFVFLLKQRINEDDAKYYLQAYDNGCRRGRYYI